MSKTANATLRKNQITEFLKWTHLNINWKENKPVLKHIQILDPTLGCRKVVAYDESGERDSCTEDVAES